MNFAKRCKSLIMPHAKQCTAFSFPKAGAYAFFLSHDRKSLASSYFNTIALWRSILKGTYGAFSTGEFQGLIELFRRVQ